jgi:hypothetical protein
MNLAILCSRNLVCYLKVRNRKEIEKKRKERGSKEERSGGLKGVPFSMPPPP